MNRAVRSSRWSHESVGERFVTSVRQSLSGARDHDRRPVTIRGQRKTRGMGNIWGRKPIAVFQAEAMEGEVGALPGEAQVAPDAFAWKSCRAWYRLHHRCGHLRSDGQCRRRSCRAGCRASLLSSPGSSAPSRASAMPRWLRPCRLPAAPILMPMRRWVNSSPGSSAGT